MSLSGVARIKVPRTCVVSFTFSVVNILVSDRKRGKSGIIRELKGRKMFRQSLHGKRLLSCFATVCILSAIVFGSQPDKELALPSEYGANRYKIVDSWRERLGLGTSTRTVAKYKLYDRQQDVAFVVAVGENGKIVNSAAEAMTPRGVPASKLHPRLAERFLQQTTKAGESAQAKRADEADEAQQTVHVWLADATEGNMAASSGVSGAVAGHQENEPARFAAAQDVRAAVRAVEQNAKEIRGAVSAHFETAVQNFIETEKIARAKIVYRYQYAPAIVLRLTLAECIELEKSPLVNYLFPEEEFEVHIDESASAIKGPSVWNQDCNGEGVSIADIEPLRMVTSNPYLSATVYRSQDDFSSHPTAIGGIIRSAHADYRGIAHGCTLLNANAASFGGTDLIAATEWAIDQGASVLSMSLGLKDSSDGEFHWSDIYFDYVVHYNHVLFINSAGNSGDDPCEPNRVVGSDGRGYNSLTVGSIDSRRTASWSDDVLSYFSSYVNPASGTQKPEIVSYGSNIDATLTESPWVGNVGSGTSFSAPMVAGIAGLIISKEPSLARWPEVVKAKILVSGLAHNIEGDATLSEKDGAGAALATAAFAGGAGRVLSPSDFDADGYYELDMNVPLSENEPMRIVLVYTYPPSSGTAMPDPDSYLKSDLDLYLCDGAVEVARSESGTRNPYEIIDYTPSTSGIGRIRIGNASWHPDVSSIRVGVAWASLSTLGTDCDREPPSDSFADAATLPGWSGRTTGTNVGAGKELEEPNHAGSPGGASVWWRWTASAQCRAVIDTFGSDFDTLLAVYAGDSVTALTPIDSNDNAGAGQQSQVTFAADSRTTYYIAVDGYNAAAGDITLNWKIGQPANDAFSDAGDIPPDVVQIGSSNAGASKEPNEPDHAGNPGGASVWWRWTAPASGQAMFNTFNSNIDGAMLAIYTGDSVGTLTEVGYGEFLGDQAIFSAQSGTTYYVAVDGYNGAMGDITLNVNSQPNDHFWNATNIPSDFVFAWGSNVKATRQRGEPRHAGNSGGASVWWRWTAPASGSVTLLTWPLSDFNTLLAVYTGDSAEALTEVAFNDDFLWFGQSVVQFDAVAGTTYHIAVDGYGGPFSSAQTGNIVLLGVLEIPAAPPANDNFADAIEISGVSGQIPGSNIGASKEFAEPEHAANSGGASVWWRWTAPADGAVTMDTLLSYFDTLLAVYTGDSVGALTEIASNDDTVPFDITQSQVQFEAVAGTTYHIAVDGYYDFLFGLDTGEIILTWEQPHN